MRYDAAVRFLEVDQLGPALDAHVQLFEPLDQETLVLVLRVDEPEWIGTPAHAECAKLDVRGSGASGPKIRRGEDETCLDHCVGEAELAIVLERARLHGQRSRGGAGLGGLVDDADADAQPGEPESEDEASRTGADDEDFGVPARKNLGP